MERGDYMKLENKTYDILKYIALFFLPALATLVLTLTNIWKIPHGVAIAETITAFDTFLGALLKISSNNYYAGPDEFDYIEDGEDDEIQG
jgi:hypothetical protein